jgi:hypothetical protein
MTDDDDIQEYAHPCTNCEYHRKRAQLWRDEAYKQAGHPLPEREWVGLTDEDRYAARAGAWYMDSFDIDVYTKIIEAKLKEKNT